MSMYSLVFGGSAWPAELMGMYGLTPQMIGRYRDHWLERDGEDGLVCAVYTRNGGGNREEYDSQIKQMQALPTYVSDADDTYDSTYATFRFRMTKEQVQEWLRNIEHAEVEQTTTVEEVWEELWMEAEPNPRDMDVVWQAMIATLPAHEKEG